MLYIVCCFFFFFKQKTAYEMRISDWSSDVCSSDLMASSHTAFPRDHFRHYTRKRGARPMKHSGLQQLIPPITWLRLLGSWLVVGLFMAFGEEWLGKPLRSTKIGRASCWESVCQYV